MDGIKQSYSPPKPGSDRMGTINPSCVVKGFQRWRFFCGLFLLFVFRVCLCRTVLSVPCSLMVTCWERADFLGLFCVIFYFVYVTFPYGVLWQVWYLVVSILIFAFFLTFIDWRSVNACMDTLKNNVDTDKMPQHCSIS